MGVLGLGSVALGIALAYGSAPAGAEALNAPTLQFPWRENEQHRITGSGYGCNTHTDPWNRWSLDFDLTTGVPVTASSAGRATTWVDGAGANVVDVNHGNGFVTQYAHLSAFSVSNGQWVNQGQQVGLAGNTGFSTGPHLHFGLHRHGQARAPEPMYGPYRGGNSGFGAYGTGTGCTGTMSPPYTSKPGCPSGSSQTTFTKATTRGYYSVAQDGGIFSFAGAPFHGSMGGHPLQARMVGMARNYDNTGYWEVAADGGIFAFNSPFHGSTGSINLVSCIQGMAARSNGGYWLVAADGGVFAFNAPFQGSMGGQPLAARIQAMAATPSGNGYWLVGADGGIFSFGDAPYRGNLVGQGGAPVVSIASTPSGQGYWLLRADGVVVGFGDGANLGSVIGPSAPAVSISSTVNGDGYWVFLADGTVHAFGNAFNGGGLSGDFQWPVVGSAGLHGHSPGLTVAATPPTAVVAPATTGSTSISVAANPYFQGSVSLSVSGVPSGSNAYLTPSSMYLNQNQAGTSTLTIQRAATQATGFTLRVTACGNGVCSSRDVTVA